MYKTQEVPFPSTQFNYFADGGENPMPNYYFLMNRQHSQAPQFILPYAGVDLRCLQWSEVIGILEKQAESFKLFQLNAAYGYDWANEQNSRLILEFNAQFRKAVEETVEPPPEQGFKLPTAPRSGVAKNDVPTKDTANVQVNKKRKRASTKKGVPKKAKKGMTEITVVDPQKFGYSPVVSPISPTLETDQTESIAFYDTMNYLSKMNESLS